MLLKIKNRDILYYYILFYKDIAARSKRATMLVILIIGFTAGPAVSL